MPKQSKSVYKISHVTSYKYSSAVFLEPHILRLIQKTNTFQSLKKFSYDIKPKPEGASFNADLAGDNTLTVWFNDIQKFLWIKTEFTIEIKRENPFDFIVTDISAIKLPVRYQKDYEKILRPYIAHFSRPSKRLIEFSTSIVNSSGGSTISFLINLCTHINENFEQVVREFGDPLPISKILKERKGSCRDLTILFMETCRVLGLATRFVSGYLIPESNDEKNYLHAWPEVYIPGGGWRGYDPTQGLAVSNNHVALSSGGHPYLAAPLSGSYRGDDIKAKISYEIKIRKQK